MPDTLPDRKLRATVVIVYLIGAIGTFPFIHEHLSRDDAPPVVSLIASLVAWWAFNLAWLLNEVAIFILRVLPWTCPTCGVS